jgi:AcrR family transcriptional regulator
MTLRADAQRNLDRLLGAAAECFAEQGADASIDEIARRAGVGHGTVFRRFPTKAALLAAVLGDQMRVLTAAADAALAAPDAGEGLAQFIRQAASAYSRNRALIDAMKQCEDTPPVDDLMAAVERLVEHAQAAGALRRDVSAKDVLTLLPTASAYPEVIVAGLRPPAAS